MRPAEAPAFLRPIIARLSSAFAPESIVLFGSYAKGNARPGSDVDLLVVARLAGDPDSHVVRARQLVAGAFPPVDVVLCTPEDVLEAGPPMARSPFLQSVLENGVTVYRPGCQPRSKTPAFPTAM